MASIPEEIVDVLTTNPTTNALLTGGVYDRPISRKSTPQIFDGTYYRVGAAVYDGEEFPNFRGDYIPTAFDSIPSIRFIAPANSTGKQAIRDLVRWAKMLFEGYVQTSDYGPKFFYTWAGTTMIVDSEEFMGAVTCTLRLQVTGVAVVFQ
jgi:hypothetical protein